MVSPAAPSPHLDTTGSTRQAPHDHRGRCRTRTRRLLLGGHPNRVKSPAAHNFIPSAGSVAARQRAGNPRLTYEQPTQQGWPRPILDSGSPRRTMVLRHPTRVYQSDRASRTACRTATHPADHTNNQEAQMRQNDDPHLTNHSPYQVTPQVLGGGGRHNGRRSGQSVADRQTKSQLVTSPGPNPANRTTERHSFLPATRPASRPLRPKTSSRFPEQAPGLHKLAERRCYLAQDHPPPMAWAVSWAVVPGRATIATKLLPTGGLQGVISMP